MGLLDIFRKTPTFPRDVLADKVYKKKLRQRKSRSSWIVERHYTGDRCDICDVKLVHPREYERITGLLHGVITIEGGTLPAILFHSRGGVSPGFTCTNLACRAKFCLKCVLSYQQLNGMWSSGANCLLCNKKLTEFIPPWKLDKIVEAAENTKTQSDLSREEWNKATIEAWEKRMREE
jgi:hypothetical protein